MAQINYQTLLAFAFISFYLCFDKIAEKKMKPNPNYDLRTFYMNNFRSIYVYVYVNKCELKHL